MTGHVQASAKAPRSRAMSPLIGSRDSYNPWTLAELRLGWAQLILADVTSCSFEHPRYFCFCFILLTKYLLPHAFDNCLPMVSIWRFIIFLMFVLLIVKPLREVGSLGSETWGQPHLLNDYCRSDKPSLIGPKSLFYPTFCVACLCYFDYTSSVFNWCCHTTVQDLFSLTMHWLSFKGVCHMNSSNLFPRLLIVTMFMSDYRS